MSSQLCRGVVKLTPPILLLPKSVPNKIFSQSLALASSTRTASTSGSGKVLRLSGSKVARLVEDGQLLRLQCAFISTSNKKSDGTSIAADVPAVEKVDTATTTDKRTWTSYGFDFESEEADRTYGNMVFFWTITVCLTVMGFLMAYWPDIKLKDWSQREAYIELARREALGLPLVDPDLVPVDKFELPTEEELGDFEIII